MNCVQKSIPLPSMFLFCTISDINILLSLIGSWICSTTVVWECSTGTHVLLALPKLYYLHFQTQCISFFKFKENMKIHKNTVVIIAQKLEQSNTWPICDICSDLQAKPNSRHYPCKMKLILRIFYVFYILDLQLSY